MEAEAEEEDMAAKRGGETSEKAKGLKERMHILIFPRSKISEKAKDYRIYFHPIPP